MTDHDQSLEARVAQLESRIETLEARLERGPARPAAVPDPRPRPAKPVEKPESSRPSLVHVVDKIGIALLLLGVGFLLKYSYDQGWLSESFRVMLGGLTGAVLLAVGIYQRNDNKPLSAVLNGGAIATFYGTIYAAFELYDLIPAPAALACTVGVTMLGFVLAVRQDQQALASIATVGGFATPFLMDGGPDAIPLAIFASVVLAGSSAIYLFKGWNSLLMTLAVGGFAVVAVALDEATLIFSEQFIVYMALAVAAVATGVVPALRAHLQQADTDGVEQCVMTLGMILPVGLLPIAAESQMLEVVAASVLAVVALAMSQFGRTEFVYQVIGGVLLVMVAGLVVDAPAVILMLLGLAAAFGWLSSRQSSFALIMPCLVTLGAAGLWSAGMMIEEAGEVFATPEARTLVFSVATLIAIGFSTSQRVLRWGLFYMATFAGMALLVTQLDGMQGAEVIVTTTWGLVALVMLVAGFVRDDGAQQALGIIAVLLTAGKLLFIDLESVATITRVLLFMAMGATLLFVSYLVPRWQGEVVGDEAREGER